MVKSNLVSFVILSVVCGLCSAKSLPSYIERCSESDPQIDECMTKQANNMIPRIEHGDRKLHIPDLSPLIVHQIQTSIGRLNLSMNEINIYGLDKSYINSIVLDKEARTLTLKIFIPEVLLKSDYTMKGQVLILPVEGSGPMEIRMGDANFIAILSFDNLGRDAKENIIFLESVLDYTYKSLSLRFDNLFNGNKQLGDPVNKLLNESSDSIHSDFKPIFIETINTVLKSIIRQVFQNYHYSDLFLP